LTPLVEAQIQKKMVEENLSYEEASKALLSQKQPSGRFVSGKELSDAVLFLCSDSAQNMTGSSIVMDGGWTAV